MCLAGNRCPTWGSQFKQNLSSKTIAELNIRVTEPVFAHSNTLKLGHHVEMRLNTSLFRGRGRQNLFLLLQPMVTLSFSFAIHANIYLSEGVTDTVNKQQKKHRNKTEQKLTLQPQYGQLVSWTWSDTKGLLFPEPQLQEKKLSSCHLTTCVKYHLTV